MGNSEVGHLNLGAGAVVKQDLAAHRRGDRRTARSSRTRRCALRAAERRAALHLLGLVSDGGVHSSWTTCEALHRAGRARGRAGRGRPRVHRRPRHRCPTAAPATWPRWSAGGGARGSRRSPAATTPWTATSAGTAPSSPTTRSCTGEAEFARRTGEEAVARGLRARRDRRVHQADASSATRAGSATATARSSSTSGPTARAS